MEPEPEKRSSACSDSKSMKLVRTLNMFSLAKSVVGRASKDCGGSNRRPRSEPAIMRIRV